MPTQARVLSLVVLTILLAGVVLADLTPVGKQLGTSAAPTTMSAPNTIPDFYAEGRDDTYSTSVKLTSKGGYLSQSGSRINLTPWGYVTADWNVGKVYIIFLANVTETSFYLAFLYLTNSSTPMIIRTFDYRYPGLRTLTLNGVHYVYARLTTAPSIPMPTLAIAAKATTGNKLSAIGPELYINGDSGEVVNGTDVLKVFPLFWQIFDGPDDYSELWSLMTDALGSYYFGIFYMPNNERNHVILEHQLRLGDYKRLDGRSFEATWGKQRFSDLLTVTMPFPSLIKVNGFQIQTDGRGIASIYLPKGTAKVEVPGEVALTTGRRWYFYSWGVRGNSNPLSIELKSSVSLVANYKKQFVLTVDSEYGEVQGAGWYNEGTNATITAPDMITSDNGTRRVFVGWLGDHASSSSQATILMDSPKHVLASWRTQYEVKLQLIGVPANSSVELRINGQPMQLSGSVPAESWFDSGTRLVFEVGTVRITNSGTDYYFAEFRVDNQVSAADIVLTKPIALQLVYSATQKTQSTIALQANSAAVAGYPVTLSGALSAEGGPFTVSLFDSSDNTNWRLLANVTTAPDGTFAYSWRPLGSGTYFIRAYWAGDLHHSAAWKVISLRVEDSSSSDLSGSDLSNTIQHLLSSLAGIPIVSVVVAVADSFLRLGFAMATALAPGGPIILGYIIGSLLIGFVFVFPISALTLSVRAARTHRPPRAIWLTPILIVWLAAMGLLVSGTFLIAPRAFVEVAKILLVWSNAILMPMAFSIALARFVAT